MGLAGLRQLSRAGAAAGAAALGLAGLAGPSPAMAMQTSPVSAPAGPVSATPAAGTPHLLPDSSPAQQVRQLVQCRKTMYAVGRFTTIQSGSTNFTRNNAFSFSATAPYRVTSWNPNVNGVVNSIAFNGNNCTNAYIGGNFTVVHGTSAMNIAEVNTRTGAVISSFRHDASGQVETLLGVHGHILAGGFYQSINGSSADPYMTSLSPRTGRDDRFVRLHISGHYQFPGVAANATRVYNQALSHTGRLDLVMGDFTSVGGQRRQQIFMLSLRTWPASVTRWTSPEWDGSHGNLPRGYPYQCAGVEPDYIRAAAWSSNDSTIYIGTTGYHPWNLPTGSYPRSGLCDAAAAFPAVQRSVTHLWVNYTGCDSLYSAAADASTAYFGGHERWSENPDGCDGPGPGAISAPGMEGLSPSTGALTFNPTRARGLGADDMLLTGAGLWIASDDYDYSQACGGVSNLAGICFLPYRATSG